MSSYRPDRRDLLRAAAAGGALVGSGLLERTARAANAFVERKTERVILIAFSGGVRTRETFGRAANVPNLAAMAAEGVLYPRMRTGNLGHFGATLSIFTGRSEARGIRENVRGDEPTLFEYLRRDAGLRAEDVWITTSGGAQQTNYAYGLHPDYGPRYGANTLDGDGIFNRDFKALVNSLGKPREMGEEEQKALESMRRSIGSGLRADRSGAREDREALENAARIESYILAELSRGTADLRGEGAPDAKALRLARNLVSTFRPKLTAVVLQNADVAHGSYNGYVEVVRRNDAAIGEIWKAVRSDPALASSTAIFVLPEFGRDADLNSRRGLDHGDGSEDLRYVAGVAWGPDFRRGSEVRDEVATIDVTPTICRLFGIEARLAKGRELPRLFA